MERSPFSNTEGADNTAVGWKALFNNTPATPAQPLVLVRLCQHHRQQQRGQRFSSALEQHRRQRQYSHRS
jgi:hypothetical protein